MKRLSMAIFFVIALLFEAAVGQQANPPTLPSLRAPRTSQGQSITQAVGLSEVNILYHRPGVKGRTIWGPKGSGALLSYGDVWRAGANEPTLFTFSHDVTIAGKRLRAGTYRFLAIPGEKEWTLIFNSEIKNWGTIYQHEYDTLRFAAKPEKGPHEEWLSFSFTDLSPVSATVVLAWEKVRIPFNVEFNLLPLLQASVGTWSVLNAAARVGLENDIYLKESMEWVDRSLAFERNFFNLRTKAELLAKERKYSEAVVTAEEGLQWARPRIAGLTTNQKQQVKDVEKMVSEWKKM